MEIIESSSYDLISNNVLKKGNIALITTLLESMQPSLQTNITSLLYPWLESLIVSFWDLGHRSRGRGHRLLVDKITITISGRGVFWRWNVGDRFEEIQLGLFLVPTEDFKLNGLVSIMNFVHVVIPFVSVYQSVTSQAFKFPSAGPPFRGGSPFGRHEQVKTVLKSH